MGRYLMTHSLLSSWLYTMKGNPYIHYHQLPLPPIYGWKNGYLCGTHPWPARQWTVSIENGWREVYDVDPGIVLAAAEKIDSARAFLKEVQA